MAWGSQQVSNQAWGDYSRLKILIVEDNRNMRSILGAVLKGAGMVEIREASDGAQALQVLKTFPADLALVDFTMSPVDGIAFTTQVRCAPDAAYPYLPIIMVTGHAQKDRVMDCRDAGVTEFVVKPLTARTLLHRIETIVRHPRPFIRCAGFFGPDRRRRRTTDYPGPHRRRSDVTVLWPD